MNNDPPPIEPTAATDRKSALDDPLAGAGSPLPLAEGFDPCRCGCACL